jgi:hypothetical protein
MAKKLPYKEGDWFAVPLENGGYGVGLIARSKPGGRILLGYFFGPRREHLPSLNDVQGLTVKDAILVRRFGDLGLYNKEWPIIGPSASWNRKIWPMPSFVREDVVSGETTLIDYSEDDLTEVSERPGSPDDLHRYPEDGLSGYGAIGIKLTDLLSR